MRGIYEATVRGVYDETCGTYAEHAESVQGYYEVARAFLAAHAIAGRRVLDVGCGPGHLTAGLPAGVEVAGIDLSPAMIEAARAARPAGRWECRSYHDALSDLGRFDAVVALGTLEFCLELDRVLARLARALAPGGRLLVTVPERRVGGPGEANGIHAVARRDGTEVAIHLFTVGEMEGAIAAAGLAPAWRERVRGWTDGDGVEVPYVVWELEAAAHRGGARTP